MSSIASTVSVIVDVMIWTARRVDGRVSETSVVDGPVASNKDPAYALPKTLASERLMPASDCWDDLKTPCPL